MEPVAKIYTDFKTKFGVPRQSNLVKELEAKVVFEPKYRSMDAVRGIEEFSHVWLVWGFSVPKTDALTVRPPRLGGNEKKGVFATRSPFRPNPIGLSVVKLLKVECSDEVGPVLWVGGADLVDETLIYDVKPYLTYVDCVPEAVSGFARYAPEKKLSVNVSESMLESLPESKRKAVVAVLEMDPRPAYQNDPERVYGFEFANHEVKFLVDENILTVISILPLF